MTNSIFYEGSAFTIGNKEYGTYICIGQRDRGKTTYWLETATNRTIKDILKKRKEKQKTRKKFVFLRREEKQLKLVFEKGLYNGVRNKNPNFVKGLPYECKDGRIFFRDVDDILEVGYYSDLNNVKGISLEDTDVMVFDEIVEPTRGKYKGGDGGIHEPELFARLDETVYRHRDNWFILLGNEDSPTNPYCEYWHIPYGVKTYRDKERGIFYEFDSSEAMTEYKETTSTGRRWKGTQYAEYSNGIKALGEINNDLICDRPKQAVLMYNVKISGTMLTIWQDENTGINYITDDCKPDLHKPVYSVTTSDMSINSIFVSYNADFIRINRRRYGRGLMRFNNQKTATLFMIMMSLTN